MVYWWIFCDNDDFRIYYYKIKKNMKLKETKLILENQQILDSIQVFSFQNELFEIMKSLNDEHEVLNKMYGPSEDFMKFQKELDFLRAQFAKKENGNPKTTKMPLPNGKEIMVWDFDPALADERIKAEDTLVMKYQMAIDEQVEKNKKYEEALENESKFVKIKYNADDLKKEKVGGDQLRLIRQLMDFE